MASPLRIEGYVIVSADGMLADATYTMPQSLKFDADYKFFEAAMDAASLIVHGRNSYEDQPRSSQRTRLIVTRKVPALAADPANPKATLWNPAGASFEDARERVGVSSGMAAIIGGPDVFGLFMERYDVFWLSQAHDLTIPGGEGVFPGVPAKSPQDVLAAHGMLRTDVRKLDATNNVDVTAWRRSR